MEITKEGLVAAVAGVAVFGALVIVVSAPGRRVGILPDPTPTAPSGTGTRGPLDTYPDCRDAQPPCVSRVERRAFLVTESGARIPVTVVDTDERAVPRTVTIA